MINAVLVMAGIGAVLGLILAISDHILFVETDERITGVTALLPGYNCGGCGYPGCAGLAEALVDGQVDTVGLCKPCKMDGKIQIQEYLAMTEGPEGQTLKIKVN